MKTGLAHALRGGKPVRAAPVFETRPPSNRKLSVPTPIRIRSMTPFVFAAALLMLALATQAGVMTLQRLYPAQGEMIEVTGATLHVVDIGPRAAPSPPIVLIHGASSNLETMRKPLAEMLAGKHRVILIDRPGHGWSGRLREVDSTPAIQGKMIEQALEKLGVGPVIL